MRTLCIAILMALPFLSGLAFGQSHSELWGKSGEKWSPQSRLPDFSFAGYHFGEDPIPTVPVVTDVTKYGAKGDGKTDCTEAFRAALKATERGAVFVPEGRYVITGVLKIDKSNVVLRGAGPDKAVLVILKSLQQLIPVDAKGRKRNYSYGGGFVHVGGKSKGELLNKVAAPARRGDVTLSLESTPTIKKGQMVRLLMNNDNELGKLIHAGLGPGSATPEEYKNFVDWVARVVKVDGKSITLDRPLRIDVRTEWDPQIFSYNPTVTEVGIEDLTFEFPGVPKKKHLKEEGFNAINFRGADHSWVRNVHIIDSDNAIDVMSSRFCQFEKVVVKANKRKEWMTGHHALWVRGTQECLFTDFRIETKFIHDLSVEGFAFGTVFRNGSGVSLNFDHHRNAPYENLFSNLDVGNPNRLWNCGGARRRGPNSAARSTFWNLRCGEGRVSNVPNWPQINYIGAGHLKPELSPGKRWIEPLESPIVPPDLHTAQLDKRLKQTPSKELKGTR